jgi:EmrB/QacA subfamily drug resistance transporter
MSKETHDQHETNYLEHHQIVPILIGLMAGMFLAALDQTIVATSIRTIGDELNGLSVQAWVTTAYLITSTITTPLYGKLSDIFGRKPLFMWAISLFILGSLLSAAATNMYMLAGYRAIQGLGAGGLFTMALAIIGDIVPPRERSKYQGYFMAVFGTSSVLGPVVGGFFAGQSSILWVTGWRWVFLINVPIGIIALYLVNHTLHIPGFKRVDHRIDWLGALTGSMAVIPLLIVAERAHEWGATSTNSIICYTITIVGTAAFLWAERRIGDEALIPLRLFKDKTFSLLTIVGIVTGAGMFGGLAVLPLYLQIVGGASPTEAGLQLLPLTLGIMSGSMFSGIAISKIGRYKWFMFSGTVIVTASLFWMTQITSETAYALIAAMALAFGLGLGCLMQPTILAAQNAVSPRDIGVATSSVTLFRQLGATMGTGVFLSMLFGRLGTAVADRFAAAVPTAEYQAALADPANKDTVMYLQAMQTSGADSNAFDNTSWLSTANHTLVKPILDGFTDSTTAVALVAAFVVAVGIIFAFFIPNNELKHRQDGPVIAE